MTCATSPAAGGSRVRGAVSRAASCRPRAPRSRCTAEAPRDVEVKRSPACARTRRRSTARRARARAGRDRYQTIASPSTASARAAPRACVGCERSATSTAARSTSPGIATGRASRRAPRTSAPRSRCARSIASGDRVEAASVGGARRETGSARALTTSASPRRGRRRRRRCTAHRLERAVDPDVELGRPRRRARAAPAPCRSPCRARCSGARS